RRRAPGAAPARDDAARPRGGRRRTTLGARGDRGADPSRLRWIAASGRGFRRTSRLIPGGGAAMQAWYLNENQYPFVPPDVLESVDSVRGSLSNQYCDPKAAADLFDEGLDEYLLCDDLGINVVSNEHHAAINCLLGASPLILGVLARQTKKVRILSLATLITVRKDPVRVAEEYATADVEHREKVG